MPIDLFPVQLVVAWTDTILFEAVIPPQDHRVPRTDPCREGRLSLTSRDNLQAEAGGDRNTVVVIHDGFKRL